MFTTDTGELDVTKLIRFGVFFAIVGILAVLLWFVLSRGGLEVSTAADKATVSITPVDSDKEASSSTGGGLSFLPVGSYVVTVRDGQKQVKTYAEVKRFAITKLSLTPPEIANFEPVTNISTSSYAVSPTELSLYDGENNLLVFVDANNTVKKTEKNVRYESVVWQSPGNGYAVARSEDNNDRQFIKITNGSAQAFATPSPMTKTTYLAFAVSDDTLYVLQDGTLYKRFSAVYEKVTTTNKEAFFLATNKKFITLMSEDTTNKCELQIITTGSSDIKKIPVDCVHSRDYRYSAEWNADLSLLAVTTGGALKVYDTSFNVVYTVPDTAATNPVWVSNSAFVYVSANNLWKYDVTTKTSSVVGAVPRYVTLQSLKTIDEGKTFYFTGRSEDTTSLYRTVDAKKDTINAQKISESNMHELSNYCRIRFVNFTSLVISASTPQTEQPGCAADIKNYFEMIQVPQPPIQFDNTEFNFLTD